MKFLLAPVLCVLMFTSCADNKNKTNEQTASDNTSMQDQMKVTNDSKFEGLSFALDKDPVCQMPLSAGISDTAVIDQKIYGFCSPHCKETYVKENRQ